MTENTFTLDPSGGIVAQVWRRRSTFAMIFTAVLASAIIALLILPKRYSASGAVMIATPEPLPVNEASTSSSMPWQQRIGDPADLDSNLIKVVSPRLLRQVVALPVASSAIKTECEAGGRLQYALHTTLPESLIAYLPEQRNCNEIVINANLKVDWVASRYSATSVGRSRVIEVGYSSALPGVAQIMANLLLRTYLNDEKAERLEPRQAGVAWLQQEITRLSDALTRDEVSIQDFRKSHGLLQGQFASITAERLTVTTRLLAEAEATKAEAAAQLVALDKGDGSDAAQILSSRTVADLKQASSVLASQYAALSQKINSDSPILAPIRRQQEEIQRRLTFETGQVRSSIRRNYDVASAQVATLTASLVTLKQDAAVANDYETQIASMVRDTDIKRTLYVELSKRASALETEREALVSISQLVNYAEMPNKPSFPKMLPFVLGGITLAGMLGALGAVHQDKTDDRLRTPGMLEVVTGLPVLASIPTYHRRQSLFRVLARMREPSTLQESIRRLQAQIRLMGFGTGSSRTLLIASSHSREGKSGVASGLAQFAAANGQRVLLIECDLRRPAMEDALANKQFAGLTEYLAGKIADVPVIHLDQPYDFDVVMAGSASIASTELLNRPRFTELLQFAQSYDLVLIDSPPCEMLMDAYTIAPRVDGVLFCARYGHATSEQIVDSLKHFQGVGGKIIGLVLTFTPESKQQPYGIEVIQKRLGRDATFHIDHSA